MASIKAGSPEAHARALKAAKTRRSNRAATAGMTRAEGKIPPPFPASYHGSATRHVTRDLRMKEPKRKRHAYAFPASKAAIKRLDNAALQRQYRYWWEGVGRDKSLAMPARADKLVYELRDEYRKRAAATYGDLPRIQAHRARRGVRKQKGSK